MKRKNFSDPLLKFFVAVIGLFVIGVALRELRHIFIPFVIAYMLYFLFSPLNTILQRKKIPLFVIIPLNLGIVGFITFGVSRFLIESLLKFTKDIDSYYFKLNHIVRDLAGSIGVNDPFFKYFSLQRIIAKLDYKQLAGEVLTYSFDLLGGVLFVLFFFIFIVGGHSAIYNAFKRRYVTENKMKKFQKIEKKYLTQEITVEENLEVEEKIEEEKHETETKLEGTFKEITGQIQKYIISKIAMNLLAGILVSVVLLFLDVDFPFIWGAFTFFLNFIPSLGSAIALILPTLLALVQFETIGYGLLVAAIIGLIQTIIFNILEPKIIGNRLDLNPIVILLSVLIWGYIWGIIGMLLAVPLTAIIKIIISNSRSKNLRFITDLINRD